MRGHPERNGTQSQVENTARRHACRRVIPADLLSHRWSVAVQPCLTQTIPSRSGPDERWVSPSPVSGVLLVVMSGT